MKAETDSNEAEKELIARLEDARADRMRFAPVYNDYYDLSSPSKLRVGDTTNQPRPANDQDNIFDATLQELSEDFAADMADEFTPSYRPWTKHEAVEAVGPAYKDQVTKYIKGRMEIIYDTIRDSSFEEASQEPYHDMGIGPYAMMVRFTQRGPVDCEYVPLAQLLIAPGPRGGVGLRAWERPVKERFLYVTFPDVDWAKALNKDKSLISKGKNDVTVIEVYERDYSKEAETWDYYLLVNGKIRSSGQQSGKGSCPLIAGRIRVSQPSAQGLGPANKALPAARTLDRLAYLNLKRQGKVVDPPGIIYDPDGTMNIEQGFDAGSWYLAGDGFQVQEMAPQNDVSESFFTREELVMTIRRALFQDKPFQPGLTPPSATQWLGQETAHEKRKTLPRARIYQEWVLPLIYRFEWILEARGELEPLIVNEKTIRVEPRSPLSRASDIQEAQIADQLLSILVGKFGEKAMEGIDVPATMRKLKEKIGDELVEILTDDAIAEKAAQLIAQELALQGIQGGEPTQ